jgi:hypothetical protein
MSAADSDRWDAAPDGVALSHVWWRYYDPPVPVRSGSQLIPAGKHSLILSDNLEDHPSAISTMRETWQTSSGRSRTATGLCHVRVGGWRSNPRIACAGWSKIAQMYAAGMSGPRLSRWS